jgi:hypothetical protein
MHTQVKELAGLGGPFSLGRLATVLGVAAMLAGCTTDAAKQNGSDVLLVVTKVVTQAGGGGGTASSFLLSDVIRVTTPAGVFNDDATVTVASEQKNPNLPTTSAYSDVQLQRYTVNFIRSDGHNTQGIDVPYSFQGPLAGTISPGGTTDVSFILVRQSAKLEPPLSNLAGKGGDILITCIAEVTIFGTTVAGQTVSVVTDIQVTFADFGDS